MRHPPCRRKDLNPQLPDYKTGTLPIELRQRLGPAVRYALVPCRETCTASRASTPMVYEKIEASRRRVVAHSDHALVRALRVSGTEPLGCAPHPARG